MRDFYPEDMAVRDAIFAAWRSAASQYGFVPYDACVVETLDLLRRKAGEEIVDQIYAFRDKSGRELALRPEMTPTLARMVAAKQGSLAMPLKWTTIAQCFRYERTTRGRKREHYQWNLDIVGEESVLAEIEVIGAAMHALGLLGLGDRTRVHFSSRAVLSDFLSELGIGSEHHPAVFLALDKAEKLERDAIDELLAKEGLPPDTRARVFDLLAVSSLEDVGRMLGTDTPSYLRLSEFADAAVQCGLADALAFDISVVRGLAYYTGIVFEAFDVDRQFRAVFGGGRYDNLLSDVGGKPTTAVGLGFGDVVVLELMETYAKAALPASTGDVAVGFMQDGQRSVALALAAGLRRRGRKVDLGLSAEKARNFFSRAGKGVFKEAIYLGPDDVAAGTVRIKNLETREEREVPIEDLTAQG